MTEDKHQRLNDIFVKVFNQILSWEEQSFKDMGITEITLRELHVIEAVYALLEGRHNRMTEIAKYLAITPGSLTTAVNCLVKKGYLSREQAEFDRRIVFIVPTHKAEKVNSLHQKFHARLIEEITFGIREEDIDVIMGILNNLNISFEEKKALRK